MNSATLFAYISAILAGGLAFTVAWNERRSWVHFSFIAGMVILALEAIFNGLSLEFASAATINDVVKWQTWRLWMISLLPGTWVFCSLSYGRGNYREFLRRWQFVLLAMFIIPPVVAFLGNDNLIATINQRTDNGHWIIGLGFSGVLVMFLFLVASVLVLMNLERTYRASVGTIRWRIKFMVMGLGILFAVRCYTCSQALLSHSIDLGLQAVSTGALFVSSLLLLRSLFRSGHFDMDVYPSHTVLQNSFTVLLAGIYLLGIGVIAKIVAAFKLSEDEAFTVRAFIILSALVVLTVFLLSDRARFYTGRFVSRHFQRPIYDYRTVWRKFTEATASCVSQKDLCQAAVKSVSDIFQSLSVTVWIVDERHEQLQFASSTILSEQKASALTPSKEKLAEVVNGLMIHPEPVDIDVEKAPWAETLRKCHPEEFRKGGNRVCVPMVVGPEIVGLMILGDRVGATPFSWQDFDLLKCLGDQVAAGLLNARLSQKLLQAKELEAFQTMSAFFVHDLKNTANTLNLMLQNLPIHFDDPAFRADALRGVGKTVAHINRLIGRLSSIRHELQIKPVPADINDLVAKALVGWEDVAGIKLNKQLNPLPKVLFDPDQMFKVATNLIFNAREAVAREGQVNIETTTVNGWAVLAVTDNGCGMSPEFMARTLFRAFQTTKKSGLGIGMFQSKMIVEAHKGRIEVESELGKGTTFRVYLPLSPLSK
jgi:putative PEP-CTERM system histidine kinase